MSTSDRMRAAQYLRMSTDHQKYSLANQAAAIALYAESHGYELVRTYQDAGKSGVTTAGRDGLQELLADVVGGNPGYSTVLVLDVSRWGRFQDPDQGAHYEFVCRDAGVSVRYCGELFDDDGSIGSSILKHLKRVMAGEYSRELSEKVRAGKARQGTNGFSWGSPTPYGFRRQVVNADGSAGPFLATGHRKSRPDQNVRRVPGAAEEIRIIRSIFRWFAEDGVEMASISRRLNAGGQTWTDGTPWSAARVRRVVSCELVIGKQVVGRTLYQFGKTSRNDPKYWIDVQLFDPIIPLSRFNKAQKRRRALSGSKKFTNDELIDHLRSLLNQHGKLTTTIVQQYGPACISAYRLRFGSLINAYELAGFKNGRRSHIWDDEGNLLTDEALLARLKDHFILNGNIGSRSIDKDRQLPSCAYVLARFGSLPAAYAAADIPYPRPRAKGLRRRPPAYPPSLTLRDV